MTTIGGMQTVSVVICTHDDSRWHDLRRAVQSVRNQSVPVGEIVVVVDHNPPLLERIRDDMPHVTVTPNAGRPGLGDSRNNGVRASNGEIVAFLDDDAVAATEWCGHMLSAYRDPAVAGAGGRITPKFDAGRPRWMPAEFHWVIGCTYEGLPESPTPVRNLFGANMSFRRDVFDAVGGFRLGYGCDETEFCIRLADALPGRVLLYNPAMEVEHRVPPNRSEFRYFLSRCYFEGGSKAVVAHLWGRADGLAAEKAYTARTLPRGFVRGIGDAVLRSDLGGFGRAAAIVAGLTATTLGYLRTGLSRHKAASARGWTDILEPQR